MLKEPSFTFGIEEEYHLVDRTTRDLASAPPELIEMGLSRLGDRVSPEFAARRSRSARRSISPSARRGPNSAVSGLRSSASPASMDWPRLPPAHTRSPTGAGSRRPRNSAIKPWRRTSAWSAGGW